MLTELSIRNFAIIDEIRLTFHDGLTVLSGETGAGKSIIIDAVQLLAGGRASVEFVRHGQEKAEIEGLFIIDYHNHPIYAVGKQFGVEIQDGQIVLQRIITSSGKSICRVNGKLVTLAILKEFGKTLIDIHSQHETQSLMVPDNHIDLLDLYNQDKINQVKEEYSYLFNKYQNLKKRYKELSENEQEMAHRLDLLEFQFKEIEQANLLPDEDEKLEKERHQLANFERLYKGVQDAYFALNGERKGIEWLNIAQQSLQDITSYDDSIQEKAEELSNYYFLIEEISMELRNFNESMEYDPNRLNDVEARLNEISRLKKKYGSTVNEILQYMGSIEEEIEQIKNKDSHLIKLADQIKELEQDVYLEAKQLHDLRKKAAKSLIGEVHKELTGLYLEKTTFSISFEPEIHHLSELENDKTVNLHKNGFDHVKFLISTNLGEPLKELNKVASGGELSRIMLVLKKIFAKHQGVTSVIFDEVDTGVSGRVAQAIAEKIYQISKESQVLCITHLPQVAAMADTHNLIVKEEHNNRTKTTVSELSLDDQINEISRMMTGTKLTNTAKEHGKELLDLASEFKKQML
ncbi:DNA replication and repair protein RecN [Oceanobacillus limi]|uniref:DNA repair protein RecN n=1 Tax=Oceanobacillus limi TaxID=930131 RepID=A0A1H9ZN30_9BACI|nr:DNA repair protein RecN [Oceanobacillus limi]SES82593.1 DNA replication and repair protein RecN [Oceanobacillus limi]